MAQGPPEVESRSRPGQGWLGAVIRAATSVWWGVGVWVGSVAIFRSGTYLMCLVAHYRKIGGRYWVCSCLLEGSETYRKGLAVTALAVLVTFVALFRPGASIRRQMAVVLLIAIELVAWTRLAPVPDLWRNGGWDEWRDLMKGGVVNIPRHPDDTRPGPDRLWGDTPDADPPPPSELHKRTNPR